MTEEREEEERMPLTEHLGELRGRMIRSLIAIGLATILTYNYSDVIVRFLEEPLLAVLPPGDKSLYFTGITDKFFTYFQVSVIAAAGLVSPYLLFEVWGFVSPALHRHEKRFILPFLVLGSLAFFAGVAFAYYVVLPYGYKFLIEFGSPEEKAIITLKEYFGLTLKLLLGLGLIFELPVLLVLLARFGIVTGDQLTAFRKHAAVGAAVAAAIITPTPDAFTM